MRKKARRARTRGDAGMKRIFVTGAGGFVGARIMAQLSDRFELTACSSAALRAADGPALLR